MKEEDTRRQVIMHKGKAYVEEALRWLPEQQNAGENIQAPSQLSFSECIPLSTQECEQAPRILVADDNADMRDYVQRLLRGQYEVTAVADGETALKNARERHPDLILSDIMMPRLDGFELLRRVRADKDLKSIPVILLSARAGEESRVEGLDAGADDYLVKPFSARELLARVGTHLAMAKIRREAADQFPTLSERLDAEVRVRTLELQQRNVEVVEQSEMLRELSNRMLKTQDEERRRMARELHDSAGQIITALGMGMANIGQKVRQNPPLAKALEENQDLLQQLNKEIRTMSYLLHPPLLDENGLSEAIRWYTQGLAERSGLSIEVTASESFGRLDADMELAIFRIVQECLTNIHRHSGSKTATIRLLRCQDTVSVEVQDEGKGISAEKLAGMKGRSGVGIAGMRERVRHYAGTLDIVSNGNGTKIAVLLPIPVRENSTVDGLGERSATA